MNMEKVFNPAAEITPNDPPKGSYAFATERALTPNRTYDVEDESDIDADATNFHEADDGTPEWFAKMCHDMLSPDKDTTTTGAAMQVTEDNFDSLHAVFAPMVQLWPDDQVITFSFLPPPLVVPAAYTENQRTKVRTTIKEWENYGAFTFSEVGWGQPCTIRISFVRKAGSYSWVGKENLNRPEDKETMNFGWVYGNNKTANPEERATILHEFGHALGMLHEAQSAAHGGVSVKNPELVIQSLMKSQGWSRETVINQVIRVYTEKEVSNFSQVDEHSIMQYALPKEITGLDHDIRYNYELSDLDKAYMTINYPRSKKAEVDQGVAWTLERALTATGLTQDEPATAKGILQMRDSQTTANINPGDIRRAFSEWAVKAHAVKNAQKTFNISDEQTINDPTGPQMSKLSHWVKKNVTPKNVRATVDTLQKIAVVAAVVGA